MDIEQPVPQVPKVENLKSLITEILHQKTAYDCMPINSSICSIEKQASLYDAFQILINEGIQELLVWDEQQCKWIWLISLVDLITLILQAINCAYSHTPFHLQRMSDPPLNLSQEYDQEAIETMFDSIKAKSLEQIITEINAVGSHGETILEINDPTSDHPKKNQIRLKTVVKEAKLSMVIQTMIVEKIHRILIEDIDSKMVISIINFKDILLYLIRIANEFESNFYNSIPVCNLLNSVKQKNCSICHDSLLWKAFHLMVSEHRSLWLAVVERETNQFVGMLFREDFSLIFGQRLQKYLWMTVGEFLKAKKELNSSKVPEYRFFNLQEATKDIIWKIVMSKRNAILALDPQNGNQVAAIIGLLELFSLYVQ